MLDIKLKVSSLLLKLEIYFPYILTRYGYISLTSGDYFTQLSEGLGFLEFLHGRATHPDEPTDLSSHGHIYIQQEEEKRNRMLLMLVQIRTNWRDICVLPLQLMLASN
jgi:hypothetical protein